MESFASPQKVYHRRVVIIEYGVGQKLFNRIIGARVIKAQVDVDKKWQVKIYYEQEEHARKSEYLNVFARVFIQKTTMTRRRRRQHC